MDSDGGQADTPQTDLVKESPSLVKDLVNAFCEDGTWLERQGVYTLTLAEAKQRAVDIIEAVSRKDTADTPQTEDYDFRDEQEYNDRWGTDCAWMYDSRRDYEYDKALDEMERNE